MPVAPFWTVFFNPQNAWASSAGRCACAREGGFAFCWAACFGSKVGRRVDFFFFFFHVLVSFLQRFVFCFDVVPGMGGRVLPVIEINA